MATPPEAPHLDVGGAEEVLQVERASAAPDLALPLASLPDGARHAGAASGRPPRRRRGVPPTLADDQHWFLHAVTATEPPRDTAERLTRSRRLDAEARLGVYRYAYRARLHEALADDYPAVQHLLGAERFARLCDHVITTHPSRGPNLNHYGVVLRDVLADTRAPRLHHRPFATALARLEWALVEVLHSAEAPPLDAARLAAFTPAEWAAARFTPSPSLQLLVLDHPANQWFQAWREGRAGPAPGPGWSATAIYRRELTMWRMDLSPVAHGLLAALVAGAPLGDALAALEGQAGADRVMRWFAAWVSGGVFADLR